MFFCAQSTCILLMFFPCLILIYLIYYGRNEVSRVCDT